MSSCGLSGPGSSSVVLARPWRDRFPRERSIVGPKPRRRQFQKMPVRIAQIEADAALRPCHAALDRDTPAFEPLDPIRELVGCDGEGDMQRARTVMARDAS